MRRHLLTLPLLLVALAAFAEDAPREVAVAPISCELRGPRARQQLVVSADFANLGFSDGTHVAKYESLDPKIAEVSATGLILPKSDGKTTIRVQWLGKTIDVAVDVTEIAEPQPADFRTDVISAL